MLKKFEDPKLDSAFYLTDSSDAAQVMKKSGSHLKLLWNRSEGVLNLLVDQSTVQLKSQ